MLFRQILIRLSFTQVNDAILPLVWFEEGLDELGPELVDVISQAVINPPIYKNYLLCVLLGLGAATVIVGIVAAAQLCLNRHRRHHQQLINQQLVQSGKHELFSILGDSRFAQMKQLMHSTGMPKLPQNLRHACGCSYGNNGADHVYCSAHQPMLPSSSDSSRLTSASHSRNSSTGSTPPFVNHSDEDVENRKSLLDPDTKLPNTS